jgi:hypothetical protein
MNPLDSEREGYPLVKVLCFQRYDMAGMSCYMENESYHGNEDGDSRDKILD